MKFNGHFLYKYILLCCYNICDQSVNLTKTYTCAFLQSVYQRQSLKISGAIRCMTGSCFHSSTTRIIKRGIGDVCTLFPSNSCKSATNESMN